MKKVISILFASLLFGASAHAGGMIGVKYGNGDLEGTQNAYTAGSTTYNAQTQSEDHEFAAVFAEVSIGDSPVSLGVEYIPFTATVTVDGNSSDSHLELSEHTTIYALLSHGIGEGSVYFKAGYAMADIGNVKANYDGTTINSHDGDLEGPMVGVGVQSGSLGDVGIVARAELTFTDYDDVSVTTTSNGSSSVTKTAEAELTTITVSLAKTF